MFWPQTGETQYHAQLGLPDKCRVIKGLVVCNNRDLRPLDLPNGLALGCYQPSPELLYYHFINCNLSFFYVQIFQSTYIKFRSFKICLCIYLLTNHIFMGVTITLFYLFIFLTFLMNKNIILPKSSIYDISMCKIT